MLSEPIEVTLLVTRVLDELGIDYLVGGSVASSLHGIPRATQDVDLVASIKLSHVDRFAASLADQFYVDADMIRDAIRRSASFNVIHLATMLKLDVFVLGRDALSLEEMARREPYRVDEHGESIWLASAEDIVLQKLDWYRKGDEVSERQWNDALGVLKVRGRKIDLAYLRKWAGFMRLEELLERLLGDADS